MDFLTAPYLLREYAYKSKYIKDNYDIEIINYPEYRNLTKIYAKIQAKLIKEKIDIIAFSCYQWNIKPIINLCELLGDKKKLIFGGPELSMSDLSSFDNITAVKYFINGLGEESFKNLLLMFGNKKYDLKITKKSQNTYLVDSKINVNIKDLPSIYGNSFPKEMIFGKDIPVETQRGCNFRCSYCYFSRAQHKIEYKPLSTVYKELRLIMYNRPQGVRFIDSLFLSDAKRAKNILKYLHKLCKSYKPFICIENDIGHTDNELIDIIESFKDYPKINNYDNMKPLNKPQFYINQQMGYNLIMSIGIQSFNKKALESVRRAQISKAEFHDFMTYANKKNIFLRIDLILGLPHEGLESFLAGVDLVISYLKGTDHLLEIHGLSLIPNTEIYDKMNDYGYIYDKKTREIISTNMISQKDYKLAKLIISIIYRCVNSPLRTLFINKSEELKMNYTGFAKLLLDEIERQNLLQHSTLKGNLDESYWRYNIYIDLDSEKLINIINSL